MCIFKGGSTFSVAVLYRDMGLVPPDGEGNEQLSAQGCATAHREADEEAGISKMGLYSVLGGNGGSGFLGDRGLCHEEAEYLRAIYCYATDSGPV